MLTAILCALSFIVGMPVGVGLFLWWLTSVLAR
mgnify:CR=1 FL=1